MERLYFNTVFVKCWKLTPAVEALAPKPVPPAAPNVPAPNDGAAAVAPNKFVGCVVAVDPNKPYKRMQQTTLS